MSVTSLFFFCCVAGLLLIYYIVPKKIQWIVLLLGSVGFYYYAGVKPLLILYGSVLFTFLLALAIDALNTRQAAALKVEGLDRDAKKRIKGKFRTKKRWVVFFTMLVLLGVLYVLKYTNFTIDTINSIAESFGSSNHIDNVDIVLPLGISFYTFTSVAYIVDVYKEKIKAERNPFGFALYISFFPHITQGPIARYSDLAPQLFKEHPYCFRNLKFGFELFLYGMFKKIVLADRIGAIVSQVIPNFSEYGRYEVLLCVALYSIQIYADFSGCMDIVTGIAQMFGIELSKNFLHPNFSKTLPEFWRRWHATLGSFFKDYVFYPITVSGWNQKLNKLVRRGMGASAARVISGFFPIFAVWFTTGFWHGASWKFISWGMYHGCLIFLSVSFGPLCDKLTDLLKINRERFSFKLFQMVRTFILCMIGRVFFYLPTLGDAFGLFKHVFTHNDPWVLVSGKLFTNIPGTAYDLVIIFVSILILWAVSMMQEKFKVREKLEEQGLVFRWLIIFAAIFILIIYGVYGEGYNASAFLYADF